MHGFNLKSFDLSGPKMYVTTILTFRKQNYPVYLAERSKTTPTTYS